MQSEFPGVYYKAKNKSRPWEVTISNHNTTVFVGAYKNELNAALAYLTALENYWGKTAYLKLSLEDVKMFKAQKPVQKGGRLNYNAYMRMKEHKEQYDLNYKRAFSKACLTNDEDKMNSLECLCHKLPEGAKCERCYFQELQKRYNPKGDNESEIN